MLGTNWAGHHTYRAGRLHAPRSVEQLQELVSSTPRIRALGTRHSFSDLADSPGELVSLHALPPRLELGEDAVTVSAGTRYGEFVAELDAAGRAIHNLASLPHISVAGAVATGTHGSGNRNGTLSSAVAGIELVRADGTLDHLRRGDPGFDASVVALGALGVVTAVTLDTVPAFEVRQDVYEGIRWDALLSSFEDLMGAAYSVSVFTGWTGDEVGRVWLKSRTDAAAPPPELAGGAPIRLQVHPLEGMPPDTTTLQGGAPGRWHERLAHFRLEFTPSFGDELQSEYLVDRARAVDALEAIRALSDRIAPHLLITELRTMCGDPLWLSPAYQRDTLGIHFTWKRDAAAVLPLLPVIEDVLRPFGSRSHWGKLSAAPGAYERLPDFLAFAAEADPDGKFRNGYLDRLAAGR